MRILVVDDDPGVLASLAAVLEPAHAITPCPGGAAALAAIREASFDLVITDLCMPPPDGFDVLRAVRALSTPPPVVVLTGLDTARAAVEAMHLGACDVLVKPAESVAILKLVGRIEAEDPDGSDGAPIAGLVGQSAPVRRVRRILPLLAGSGEAVLILGETGTGKELMARALHEQGPRRAGPFVVHNMAATPEELAESVFFGHVRGAFSGATGDHVGLFEEAEGGTLFLDEIDSFPLQLQAKLLRVLEGGRVQRVGSNVERIVDVRTIAASAVDLGELAAAGRFRADLYYRLRQLEVTMPPLRDHLEDVPVLARHFLLEARRGPGAPPRISPAALDLLIRYRWPGNCRELRNAMRSAAVLAGEEVIQPAHLPCAMLRAVQETMPVHAHSTLLAAEREHIRETLEQAGGNRSRAARLLGIDRGTLARKLRSLDLETPEP